MSDVLVLIAASDEEGRLGSTIAALGLLPGDTSILVADDASSDRTAAVAFEAGARVITTPRHLGKGGVLEFALSRELRDEKVILFVDADLGQSAEALGPVLAEVLEGRAQMAVAVLPAQGGGFGFVKQFARTAIRTLGGSLVDEPLSGQRAVRAAALATARPLAAGFGVETAMTIDILRAGFTMVEIAVPIYHRATGRDLAGFLHRGRQGWDILKAVASRVVRG